MGPSWSFTSKGKIFSNFSQIFFHKDLFIHHGSFVFCVLSSQRVTLKYRKEKGNKKYARD